MNSLHSLRFSENSWFDKYFKARFIQVIIPTLFILAFAVFYFSHITRWMFGDEAYTVLKFSETPYHALFLYTEPNNHLLHSLLVWLSRSTIGSHVIGIRFPTFASALLSLAMIFRLGKRLGGYNLGLAALVLLSVNYSFGEYSINARGYTLTILLTLILVERCLFTKIPFARSSRYSLLLLTWALILVLPTNIFIVAALILWIIQQNYRNKKLNTRKANTQILPMIFGVFLGAIFYILPFISGQINQHVARFGLSNSVELLSHFVSLYFQPTLLNAVIAICVLAGFRLLVQKPNKGFRSLLIWMFLTSIIASIAMQVILNKLPFARNYIYLFPFVALMGAWVLSYLPRLGLIALCTLIMFISFMETKPIDNEYMDKWFPIVAENLEDTDLLLIGCCEYEPFYYYFSRERGTSMFEYDKNKTRIVFLPFRQSIEYIIEFYQLEDRLEACTFESWDSNEIYVCSIIN